MYADIEKRASQDKKRFKEGVDGLTALPKDKHHNRSMS